MTMKKPISFITFLTCTIVILSVIQVVVSNRLSTTGAALGNLQDDIQQYKTQNSLLSEEFLSLSSFEYIASQAAELGFTQKTASIVLTYPLPLAVKP